MHVLIAALCGIFDIHLLFTVAALTATTMLFGLLQERGDSSDLMALKCGFVPWVAQWLVILCYFTRAMKHAERDVPLFVHFIIWIELVLDFLFAACQLAQQKHQ